VLRVRGVVPVRFDERLDRLEERFREPEPERVEPGPPEAFSDDGWWEELREMVGEDESELARLAEIREFVELELDAYSNGKSWSECARAIEDFMLPERLEDNRRRWEETSLRTLGYVPGNCCEDCGKAGERSEPCQHCGGVVSWHGFLYKRVFSVDKLEREIAAAHRLAEAGYGGNAATLEGILERRLAEG
jgi:hypothetical protein